MTNQDIGSPSETTEVAGGSLPVSAASAGIESNSPRMIKAFVAGYVPDGANLAVLAYLKDTEDTNTSCTADDIRSTAETAIADYCTNNSVPTPDAYEWLITPPTP